MTSSIYRQGLDPCVANYAPLSPLSFLRRAARVFPDKTALIHGDARTTWKQVYERCSRLASALTKLGVGVDDTVSVLAPNVPMIFEAHFGVPMCGAVLNTINTRLDASTVAFILSHGESKVLITDTEYVDVVEQALARLDNEIIVVDYADPTVNAGRRLGNLDYEELLIQGDPYYQWQLPEDEWDAISLNYTSGTTGDPKGVVYHHRGAYLNAMSNIIGWNMPKHAVYLWTLPMFHCNGWCFPWSLAAIAGVSVCLRKVDAKNIYHAIATHGVTHFCGAPIVLNFLINASEDEWQAFDQSVNVMTAAAPPPASVLAAMEESGFHMTHVYGLTETYGPAVICDWNNDWDSLSPDGRARMKSRQGVPYHALEDLTVMDPDTMRPVVSDAETMGETMFKGNIVMKGYLKNPQATEKAFSGGWFHSGDLGVMHPDQFIELKDRSKDIIISGGENISSIEIENVLYSHPDVLEAAVVARPDDKWGETPCAFVTLKSSTNDATEKTMIDFCRDNMAGFKIPKTVVFTELPKTSTGKVQKFKLRERARNLGNLK